MLKEIYFMPLAIPLCFRLLVFFFGFGLLVYSIINIKQIRRQRLSATYYSVLYLHNLAEEKKGMHRKYTFTNRFPLMLARY